MKKILLIIVLSAFTVLSFFTINVKAFTPETIITGDTSEMSYTDFTYFDPYSDYDDFVVDTYNASELNVYSPAKAGTVITFTFPIDTSFMENQIFGTSIDQAYIIANSLAAATIYYIADYSLFTFSEELYWFYENAHNDYYTDGYNDGTGDGYTDYYEGYLDARDEFAYYHPLFGWLTYEDGVDTGYEDGQDDMYDNGSDTYGYDQTNSDDYLAGLVVGGASNVNAGITTFMTNFDKWIVPAIVVVILLGGFITIAAIKRRGD